MQNPKSRQQSKKPAFDVQAFLDSAGIAKRIREFRRAEKIFTQGEPADSVLYIQKGEAGARLTLTHEEIGQVIGTSRQAVTRLLSGFEKKRLIQWRGCNLVLTDRAALESSVVN